MRLSRGKCCCILLWTVPASHTILYSHTLHTYTLHTHTLHRHLEKNEPLHSIRVIIVKGGENISIKIADRGGGVPRSTLQQIWKFAHSTANREEEDKTAFGTDEITGSRIRGFGLPLARVYAKYFGGDLTLKSMEGYGLDAYLYLPRLGDAGENLPRAVLQSPGERDSTPGKKKRNQKRMNGKSVVEGERKE